MEVEDDVDEEDDVDDGVEDDHLDGVGGVWGPVKQRDHTKQKQFIER